MTTINPADCKPGEYYLVRFDGEDQVAEYLGHEWELMRAWALDADVTVLHRLVPERDEDTVEDARSEAEREAEQLDYLAAEVEHITGDPDTGVSPRALRAMAAEQRADDEAQAVEDALVEKTAQAIHETNGPCPSWDQHSGTVQDAFRDQARAALAVFREDAADTFDYCDRGACCLERGHDGRCEQ